MKGISPVMSVVILIAISVIMGISTYYWVAGMSIDAPEKSEDAIKIDVTVTNASAGKILLTNIDERSLGPTTLYAPEINESCYIAKLDSGEAQTCTFDNLTGLVTFYTKESKKVTVVTP